MQHIQIPWQLNTSKSYYRNFEKTKQKRNTFIIIIIIIIIILLVLYILAFSYI